MYDLGSIIKWIFADQYAKYLVALLVANLGLGVVASLLSGDFQLTKVGEWFGKRLIPVMVGYATAMLLAWANPDLMPLRDGAFAVLTAMMLGYVLKNLRDFGIPLPDFLAGKVEK